MQGACRVAIGPSMAGISSVVVRGPRGELGHSVSPRHARVPVEDTCAAARTKGPPTTQSFYMFGFPEPGPGSAAPWEESTTIGQK